MKNYHYINSEVLSLPIIKDLLAEQKPLKLSEEVEQKIIDCRNYLDDILKKSDKPFLWNKYWFWFVI